MDTAVIGKNAKRIRLGYELTRQQVAEKAGISVATYAKVESGISSPRMDTLYRIAGAMAVGIQELFAPVRELKAVRFRAQKKMKRRDQVLARAARWLDDFNDLLQAEGSKESYIRSGAPSMLDSVARDDRPQQAARFARQRMGLDQKEPIHDITGLLASSGIKLLTYPLASDEFFGMSIGESDGGPAIVVNVWDRIPVERWIFSTAHELGHLLLHLDAYDVSLIEEDKRQETEANIFAGHFLLPQEGFENEWDEAIGLSFWERVLKVKRIYHISDKTVLSRLVELGYVGNDIWQARNRFLKSKYGSRNPAKYEPERLGSLDFVTDWLDRLVRNAVEKDMITLNRASEVLNISLQDMRKRVSSWAEEKGAIQAGKTLHR